MCQEISAKMLELVEPCCIPDGRALPKFEGYADRNECKEMWSYFEHCFENAESDRRLVEEEGATDV